MFNLEWARRVAGWTTLVALLLLCRSVVAGTSRVPSGDGQTPLEQSLMLDAAKGRLDQWGLLEAALVASGVDTKTDLDAYRGKFDNLVEELRRGDLVRGTGRQQAAVVFEFMHGRILTGGYILQGTDLRQALDRGRFNCVSATVLFNCLAERFGLATSALEMPGHAMSRLDLAEGPIDVETTCPRWFRIEGTPAGRAVLVAKGPGGRPAIDRSRAHPVSAIQLLAMIYYNRGVDLLGEKRFADAAAANAKAMRLDPSNTIARGNYLATINNWAIDLGQKEHFHEAAELLHEGLTIEPHYQTFAVNYTHLCRQWVKRLCAQGAYEEALAALARAAADRPADAYFRDAQAEIYARWADALTGESNMPTEPRPVPQAF